MNRYASIISSAIFFLIAFIPCQVLAASITQTRAAIGEGCTASGSHSTAIGEGCTASNMNSIAMGYNSGAKGLRSTAIGSNNDASGGYSTAIGTTTIASGGYSTAIGTTTIASGDYSTAMGQSTTAEGYCSTAMGTMTIASAEYSNVIGIGYSSTFKLVNDIEDSFMVGFMNSSYDYTPELFVKHGGVGINTTSPSTSLHAQKNISGDAQYPVNNVAVFENTSAISGADVILLKVKEISDPAVNTNFITFSDKTKSLGSIEGNGSGGIQLNTSGGDFAEYLPKVSLDEELNPGDIVGLFPEGLSKNTQNAQRIMVATTAPAVLGNRPKKEDASLYVPVAFLGQVPVKIEGTVCSGDYIIPSGCADGIGIAVSPLEIKPIQYGSIVGRCLESNSEKRTKTMIVLVGLPQNGLWNGLVKEKETRISELEERLAVLEAKSDNSFTVGLLPGSGIIMGSLGLFWMDRRRRRL